MKNNYLKKIYGKIGCELTFHRRSNRGIKEYFPTLYPNNKGIIRYPGMHNFQFYFDNDDTLEINTPPVSSRKELIKIWRKVQKLRKICNLKYTGSSFIGTGGGHIHISPINYKDDMYNFILDGYNRPYLDWMFNDPIDNINGCFSHIYLRNIHRMNFSYLTYFDFKRMPFAPRRFFETVEYRIFDMPRTEEQFMEHIEFAIRHFNLTKKRTDIILDRKSCKKQAIKNFRNLIEKLELDWNIYKKYVKNFEKRFSIKSKENSIYQTSSKGG